MFQNAIPVQCRTGGGCIRCRSLACRQPARRLHARLLSRGNVHTPSIMRCRASARGGIIFSNVEEAEVCLWLRLANPKVQRKSPSPRRLNGNRDARAILRAHPQPPRTAPDLTPRFSSTPLAKAGKLCSFRKSKPSSPKGIPQTRYFIFRPAR